MWAFASVQNVPTCDSLSDFQNFVSSSIHIPLFVSELKMSGNSVFDESLESGLNVLKSEVECKSLCRLCPLTCEAIPLAQMCRK